MSAIHAPMFTNSDGCGDPLTDPHFASVVFLSHFNGVSPVDEKGHTITGSNNAASPTLFGDGSGVSPFIVAPSSDFDLGTGDYTVEGATYYDGAANKTLFSTIDSSGDVWWPYRFYIEVNGSNYLSARFYDATAASYQTLVGSTAITANTWFRWAITRTGGIVRLFLNGVIQESKGFTFDHTSSGLSIGQAYPSSGVVTGYFDEVRITKGVCRYTSNYATACRAFPNN